LAVASIAQVAEFEKHEAVWFLGTLGIVKASSETTGGQMALIEQFAPRGAGSPLHVHHNEDEWFYVIEGELTLWIGGEVITLSAGGFAFSPRDIPHTFTVSSEHARFLLGVHAAGFEGFMRALSEPATSLTVPPPADVPPDIQLLALTAAEYGLEILGPPGIPV
jgi:quercetin dioxygenase-like cupin family protein